MLHVGMHSHGFITLSCKPFCSQDYNDQVFCNTQDLLVNKLQVCVNLIFSALFQGQPHLIEECMRQLLQIWSPLVLYEFSA